MDTASTGHRGGGATRAKPSSDRFGGLRSETSALRSEEFR
ncbi:MAG: hypothetical protein AVDCRST_MAG67-2648 [uncultured Solirubrobacteraceae bacterium]|uniref:Uncharacterized protein n=1 Tax=uncultured Solirubrobacteraceae bacterium TaxID=1162706 RepID=A0A6J4T092_9ACTN|nr:MAG: hypothetical protein AVDCRST_MAG67-2648 [uncultured Solirubrobacteraceae bacterium]